MKNRPSLLRETADGLRMNETKPMSNKYPPRHTCDDSFTDQVLPKYTLEWLRIWIHCTKQYFSFKIQDDLPQFKLCQKLDGMTMYERIDIAIKTPTTIPQPIIFCSGLSG